MKIYSNARSTWIISDIKVHVDQSVNLAFTNLMLDRSRGPVLVVDLLVVSAPECAALRYECVPFIHGRRYSSEVQSK